MADYRISSGATVVAGTGTLTVNAGATAVTGAGTNFTVLAAGDLVLGGAVVAGSVATVTSDLALTLAQPAPTALAGAAFNYDPMVLVSSLSAGSIDPLGDYQRWREVADLGNGLARGTGRPLASWLWLNPAAAQRTAILAYCTSKSARVYIRTLIDPSLATFATFQAAMLWPDTDNLYNQEGFRINFRDLVAL